MAPTLNHAEHEALAAVRGRLKNAPRGSKTTLVAQAAAQLGMSVPTLYRKLEAAGLDTRRKTRCDAGNTSMTEAELRLVSGVLYASRRDNDKQLLSIQDALDILAASGQLATKLSAGHVGQLLRAHHMHPEQLAQQRAAVTLRSLHPNHVWQIDSSTCVLYYMKNGALASMDADQFYANKPHNYARVLNDLCTRYIAVDHASGAFKGRYFLGGERAETVCEFLIWAVMQQPGVPMHGVPLILMLDKGPGNTSHLLLNLCKNLGIEVIHHAVGNARAIGAVERMNGLWEQHFEGLFKMMPNAELTLDGINDMGCDFARWFGTQDKHSRHGEPRNSVWMRITPDQLRVPASLEVLRELVTSVPEQRRVSNYRTITVAIKGLGSRTYDLSLVPGVVVGGKVTVAVNAYRAPHIDVQVTDADTGEQTWQTVAPVEYGEFGFPAGDASVTIGEHLRTASNTPVDVQRNRIQREAYRPAEPGAPLPSLEDAEKARKNHQQAYAGVVDAMAHIRSTPVTAFMPKRGTPLEVATRTVAARVLSHAEACAVLKGRLGAKYRPQMYTELQAALPDGVPEDQLDAIEQAERAPLAASLRAVGGSAA